ncbi:type II toxin-antitoxin system RelE/ParE family toxin, partial [Sinorhizobium meliloti]
SLRYAYELGLPDLRSVSLKRYPYLIFYRDQPDHVDVWRVLHGKRDIPQWMQEPNNH